MRYFVIQEDQDESNVYVSDIPEGLVRKYQLLKGISRAVGWPADMAARFSDIRPEGMRLTDWVATPFGWLLISDRFKKTVEDSNTPRLEFLPIKMKNHKKKIVAENYWIVNFLDLVEAVDRAKSVFEVDAGDDEKIFSFDVLVLSAKVEAKGPPIFRLKEQPRLVLVREDLAGRIKEARLTGLKLTETAKYKSLPSPPGSASS